MKRFEFRCPKHGMVIVEVERPPLRMQWAAYCPLCLNRLSKIPHEEEKKQEKWQAANELAPA